jgi:phospholipase A2
LFTHICDSVHTHVANIGNFLGLINSSKYNAKAIMEGIVQRYDQQNGSVNLVDIFGMLLGAILLTNKDPAAIEQRKKKEIEDKNIAESKLKNRDGQNVIVDENSTAKEDSKESDSDDTKITVMLPAEEQKISHQQQYIKDGASPMPIYCVVRHAIKEDHAIKDEEKDAQSAGTENPDEKAARPHNANNIAEEAGNTEKKEDLSSQSIADEVDLYQWFEFTPYEVGSEELSGKNDYIYYIAGSEC